MGGWTVLPEPGMSILEQPRDLIDDLLTWKHLLSIARRQKERIEKAERHDD